MFYSRVDRLVIQVLEVEMSVAQTEASDLFFLAPSPAGSGRMEKPVQITRLPKSRFYEKIFEIDERQVRVPPQIPLSSLSKLVAERVVTDVAEPIPDCVTCGACCVYGLVIPINRREPEPLRCYVEVTLDESPDIVIERTFERDEKDGRCVNMSGEVGVE